MFGGERGVRYFAAIKYGKSEILLLLIEDRGEKKGLVCTDDF